MSARNYRSLRAIRMDLSGVNLFIGENGVGKSNLYRALQLIQAAARGTMAREIAAEGGMASALWSGPRRSGDPVRIGLEVEALDEENAVTFRYRVETGIKPPMAAGFALEPQVKTEELVVDAARPVTMMKRSGPSVSVRDGAGRMRDHAEGVLASETALASLGNGAIEVDGIVPDPGERGENGRHVRAVLVEQRRGDGKAGCAQRRFAVGPEAVKEAPPLDHAAKGADLGKLAAAAERCQCRFGCKHALGMVAHAPGTVSHRDRGP